MNIDILNIVKLLFAIFDDTEIRDNKTFQTARAVVDAIQPSDCGHQQSVSPSGNPAAESCNLKTDYEV